MSSIGEALQRARKRLRLSQTAVAQRLSTTRQVVSAFESDRRGVSAKELQVLCNLYRVYPNDLLGFKPVAIEQTERAAVDFRMNDVFLKLSEHDRREVVAFGSWDAPGVRGYFPRWQAASQRYVTATESQFGLIQRLTEQMREDFGQGEPPINIYLLAEKLGVFVVHTYLEQVSAVLCRADEECQAPPRIVVNSNQPTDRQRFSVAHEIAHLLLHRGELVAHAHYFKRRSDQREIDADTFAAELLMPRGLLRKSLDSMAGQKRLEDAALLLANLYQVSYTAMVMRMYNLGHVTRVVFNSLKRVKPSRLEGARNTRRGKQPFNASTLLPAIIVELELKQEPSALSQEVVRKLQEMAYTRYIGSETAGGSVPMALYQLDPPGNVYEKVALWVANKYPMKTQSVIR